MSIAHEMVEKFLKGLSPDDAAKAVIHIREMVSNQSLQRVKQFIAEYDSSDQLDNIIVGIIAANISSIGKSATEFAEKNGGACGIDVARIAMKELRSLADHIEKESYDAEKCNHAAH